MTVRSSCGIGCGVQRKWFGKFNGEGEYLANTIKQVPSGLYFLRHYHWHVSMINTLANLFAIFNREVLRHTYFAGALSTVTFYLVLAAQWGIGR